MLQKFRFNKRFMTRNEEKRHYANKYANNNDWNMGSAIYQSEKLEIARMAKEQKLKPFTKPVRIRRFFKYRRTNQDGDNLESMTKVIQDGLISSGILPGDSLKWIVGYDQTEFTKSEDEGGEFHIYEVE